MPRMDIHIGYDRSHSCKVTMPLSTRLALELFLLRGTADPAENAPFRKGGYQALTLLGDTRPAPRVRDARIQRRG